MVLRGARRCSCLVSIRSPGGRRDVWSLFLVLVIGDIDVSRLRLSRGEREGLEATVDLDPGGSRLYLGIRRRSSAWTIRPSAVDPRGRSVPPCRTADIRVARVTRCHSDNACASRDGIHASRHLFIAGDLRRIFVAGVVFVISTGELVVGLHGSSRNRRRAIVGESYDDDDTSVARRQRPSSTRYSVLCRRWALISLTADTRVESSRVSIRDRAARYSRKILTRRDAVGQQPRGFDPREVRVPDRHSSAILADLAGLDGIPVRLNESRDRGTLTSR